jgi:hypothetical protein
MDHRCSRWHQSIFFIAGPLLTLLIAAVGSSRAGTMVSVSLPIAGSTVSGSVTIASAIGPAVSSVNFYIDGVHLASGPPLIIDWDSRSVSNGNHTISVTAYGRHNAVVGSSSVTVNVNNLLATYHVSSSVSSNSNTGAYSSHLSQAVSEAAIKGVYYKVSLVKGEHCPSTLPANVTGCSFRVKWAQVEPRNGVYDWYSITNQESLDTTNYPLQVEIEVGESGVPNSAAVCNSFTPESGAPTCWPWLASAQGIHTHYRRGAAAGGWGDGIAPCAPTYENYPGNIKYQTALAMFERAFHNRFAGDPKIALVSINPMSENGHNTSLPVQIQNVVCPDGSTLSETYNAAWNAVAINHGCSSGNEACWRNLIVKAFETIWATQVSILHDMNLSLWITAYSWPAITGPGQYDNNKDPDSIQQRIFAYANAHQPAHGAYYVSNEALGDTKFWSEEVGPWLTGPIAATGGGAEMLKAFSGGDAKRAGCVNLCTARVLCGAYSGARFQQVYIADINSCPGVISQIAHAINGDTTQACRSLAVCTK